MLNHTKRDKLAAEVTVTYRPRFPEYCTLHKRVVVYGFDFETSLTKGTRYERQK